MPQQVTANDGDTLCGLAIAAGFLNCDPIRNFADNAGAAFLSRPLQAGDVVSIPDIDTSKKESKSDKARYTFVKKGADPVAIRFVHGSPDKPYADDDTLDKLIVSKYITDKAGTADGSADLPDASVCEFNQNGHNDVDTFKLEVFEPNKNAQQVVVTIEALKPLFDSNGTLTSYITFDGSVDDPNSERGKRSLKVTAKKVGQGGETHRCRTPYLRLVADDADKTGTATPFAASGFPVPSNNSPKPTQTVLITDMVDQNDDTLEILDQLVRASTPFPRCSQSGDKKCVATATLPIGDDRQRLRVAIHIVRTTVGGSPIVTTANAKRRVLKWCRRIFAQANIAPKLLQVREVDPVENLICISDAPVNGPANAGGRRAAGDGTLGFTINAAGQASQAVGPITPPAGQSALDTAQQLAALVQAPYTATVSPNPRRFNDALASCDILITEASGAHVSISNPLSNDSAQTLTVASVNPLPAANQSWDGFNFLVGTPHQRVLCKNYDTGDDRIDVFVIRATTDGNRGEAMMDGHSIVTPADQHGVPGVRFSLFVIQSCMDGSDSDPLVLSHEMGHVAAEVLHAKTARHQLMHAQVTGNNAVGASKRIRNGGVAYDNSGAGTFNFIERVRSEGAGLLEGW